MTANKLCLYFSILFLSICVYCESTENIAEDVVDTSEGDSSTGKTILVMEYTADSNYSMYTVQPSHPYRAQLLGQLPDLNRSLHAAELVEDGKLLLAGGEARFSLVLDLASTEFLDLKTLRLSPGPSMRSRRRSGAMAVLDGVPYICGGTWYNDDYDDMYYESADHEAWVYMKECERLRGGQWEWVGRMRWERGQGHALVECQGHLYAIGGGTNTNWATSAVERYSPSTNTWKKVAPLPEGRCRHSAAVVDGKIYVTGGYRKVGPIKLNSTNTLWSYTPATNVWNTLAPLEEDQEEVGMVELGHGKLAVVGGTRIHIYDIHHNNWTSLDIFDHEIGRNAAFLISSEWLPDNNE